MKTGWVRQKAESSIFFKLLLIFAGVSLVTVITIYLVLSYLVPSPDRELIFRLSNRTHYAELLVKEFGDPQSNFSAIQHIADDYGITIRIDLNGKPLFTSDPSAPTAEEAQKHSLREYQVRGSTTGLLTLSKIYLILERKTDQGLLRYLFLFPYDPFMRARPGVTVTITTLVLLLLLATFLFTRKLLRPLRGLHEGVLEISEGHWDHRVPEGKSDELGDLARSFNHMSERIRGMIEAKEQLLLDVSHELRSPLARIAVALEIPGSEDVIRRNLKEVDAMIAELLESARLPTAGGALKLEKTDLPSLVSDVAGKFTDDLPGVRLNGLPSGLVLELDPPRVRAVIKNVIENAIKFSPKDRKPVEISIAPGTSEFVKVIVRDYGVGISAKELDLVFEPFYRVDKSRCKDVAGYGLGLSLCRRIMRAHGGDIELSSTPGEGTEVSVIFRATSAPS